MNMSLTVSAAVVREANFEASFSDHLLEQVLLVQKQEDRSILEHGVAYHLCVCLAAWTTNMYAHK